MKLKVETLAPLTDIVEALSRTTPTQTALELSAMLKRAESMLESLRDQIKPEANAEFLTKATADKNELLYCGGTVVVMRYTAKSFWNYPLEVIKQDNKLRDMQKQAQMTGAATKESPLVDPKRDTIFAIKVKES